MTRAAAEAVEPAAAPLCRNDCANQKRKTKEERSALDNITQKKVSEAIDTLKCTRIVIAHRLSTIQHADRIIFLDGGKIVEDGTYDELIAKGGFFAKLVERQRLDLDA